VRAVVVGSGRSGSKWAAVVLRVAGYRAGHEQAYTTGMLADDSPPDHRWAEVLDVDCTLAAVPYLLGLTQVRRVLLVRHPLGFATSLCSSGPLLAGSAPAGLTTHLHAHHPDVMAATSEAEAAVRFWTVWNSMAAKHADVILRLEDVTPAGLVAACDLVPRLAMLPVPPVGAGPRDVPVSWDDVPDDVADEARTLAARMFGYHDG